MKDTLRMLWNAILFFGILIGAWVVVIVFFWLVAAAWQ